MIFFNKKENTDTTPEWVKGVCLFLKIQEIPECKDWEIAQAETLFIILSQFSGSYNEDLWFGFNGDKNYVNSFLHRVCSSVVINSLKENSIEINLKTVGYGVLAYKEEFKNKFYEAINRANKFYEELINHGIE